MKNQRTAMFSTQIFFRIMSKKKSSKWLEIISASRMDGNNFRSQLCTFLGKSVERKNWIRWFIYSMNKKFLIKASHHGLVSIELLESWAKSNAKHLIRWEKCAGINCEFIDTVSEIKFIERCGSSDYGDLESQMTLKTVGSTVLIDFELLIVFQLKLGFIIKM